MNNELIIYIIIFILLSSIPEKTIPGKRIRKKILRELKKQIKIQQKLNKKNYIDCYNKANNIMYDCRAHMIKLYAEKGNYIDPSSILQIILFKTDYFKNLNINFFLIDELKEVYSTSNLGWQSIKYTNFILKELDETRGQKHNN